jgi:ligand-binding sensor domain-containing protein/two-component sensor histidine kinase
MQKTFFACREQMSGFSAAIKLILFFYLIVNPLSVNALESEKPITQYVRKTWTKENGLPSPLINAVVQTRDGYLWAGTPIGLIRFDGIRFEVFDSSTTPILTSNYIRVLLEDRHGCLWIGTDGGGVIKYQNGEFTKFDEAQRLANEVIWDLFEDRDGSLWIGTASGVSQYRENRLINFSGAENFPKTAVFTIEQDRTGRVWVGTESNGIYFFEGEKFVAAPFANETERQIVKIYENRAGEIWVGTSTSLYNYDGNNLKKIELPEEIKKTPIYTMLEDADGSLWVGTYGSGLLRFSASGAADRFTIEDGLPNNDVFALCEDREGNIWVGTNGGGLTRLTDGNFASLTLSEGLPHNAAQTLWQTADGSVYFGTDGGLMRWLNGQFTKFTTREGLSSNFVTSLYEDSTGRLWVGTRDGVNLLENGRLVSFFGKDELKNCSVSAILRDSDGAMWFGTVGQGLLKIKNRQVTKYYAADGLVSNQIYALMSDGAGTIWVGTRNGVNLLQNGRVIDFFASLNLPPLTVTSFRFEEASGIIWILGNGITRFQNGQAARVTRKQGLPSNFIFQMLTDNVGNYWFSSENGIFKIERNDLHQSLEDSAAKLEPKLFDVSDGLESDITPGGANPAGWKTDDGRIWFATSAGFAAVNPSKLRFNRIVPPVIIEEIKGDDKTLKKADTVRLAAGTIRVELQFTALSFVNPAKNQFRYKLEGFDTQWNETSGEQRTAVYTNLPPGNYRFRVIAANNDGVWNETGASAILIIEPWFYQTWWFYLVCFSFISFIVYSSYQYRVGQLRKRYEMIVAERTRIAREMHDTLLQGYVGISSQLQAVSEHIKTAPELAARQLEVAQRMIGYSVTEARRAISDLRSNENLNPGNFHRFLREAIERILTNEKMKFNFKIDGESFDLPENTIRQILRIAEEATANAVKHAAADNLQVVLFYQPELVRLIVVDDGKGFAEERKFSTLDGHFGVLGMKERAESVGGKLVINTAPGKGTTILAEFSNSKFVPSKNWRKSIK